LWCSRKVGVNKGVPAGAPAPHIGAVVDDVDCMAQAIKANVDCLHTEQAP
jgi:hypothetical protein